MVQADPIVTQVAGIEYGTTVKAAVVGENIGVELVLDATGSTSTETGVTFDEEGKHDAEKLVKVFQELKERMPTALSCVIACERNVEDAVRGAAANAGWNVIKVVPEEVAAFCASNLQ